MPNLPQHNARTGAASQRRVWRCRGCRKQFSVLTGTLFHGSKVSLRKWALVIFEMCASKNGVSAREIERKYGLCARTAWFMLHRIRAAMEGDALVQTMRGVIAADETWIGGDPKNRHSELDRVPRPVTYVFNQKTEKTPVLSLVNRTTGEVRSRVVRDVTGATLRKVISEHVDMAGSTLHTDEGAWYIGIGKDFIAHETVNHSHDEYVRKTPNGTVTTNHLEGFFAQVKRSLDGTHHRVSREHLQRYLDEFDFRYTTRKLSDAERMRRVIGQIGGRRLTYKGVTA